ncbi:MAG: hypothetical protein ABSB95_09330 [Dissulfurispiraceae bacterium]|jgi:hypothetical protein
MRVLEKKDKDSMPLKIDGGKEYVAFDNKKEEEYLKFAAHLLSNDLSQAIYRLETRYLFVKRTGEVITFDARAINDDSEAKFEIDSFFEGRSAEVFDDSEVPEVKKGLFSDKRVALAIILVAIAVFFYTLFKVTEPKKNSTINNNIPSTPSPLSDNEKEKLTVAGTRKVAEQISMIISSVRQNAYARIASMTVQKTENPQSVSYIVVTNQEYRYPEIGSVSKDRGIWGKGLTDTVSLERKDISPVQSEDFDVCSLQMLNNGFYVQEREDKCVHFVYEGDAAKTVDSYNSLMRCNATLNSMTISTGKGKLDVSLCQNEAIGNRQ